MMRKKGGDVSSKSAPGCWSCDCSELGSNFVGHSSSGLTVRVGKQQTVDFVIALGSILHVVVLYFFSGTFVQNICTFCLFSWQKMLVTFVFKSVKKIEIMQK